jgi:hypothetical protein
MSILDLTLTTNQIKRLVYRIYKEVNEGSIISSDYSYNRINEGINFDVHYLEFTNVGSIMLASMTKVICLLSMSN